MAEETRLARARAINAPVFKTGPLLNLGELFQKNQDSDFAGPQHLSFESLMDLNHLNNFQLSFTIYIICSYESLKWPPDKDFHLS